MDLHIEEGDYWGTWVARTVEFVVACCEAYAMCLWFLWADVADEVCVGDFPVFGDPVFCWENTLCLCLLCGLP